MTIVLYFKLFCLTPTLYGMIFNLGDVFTNLKVIILSGIPFNIIKGCVISIILSCYIAV